MSSVSSPQGANWTNHQRPGSPPRSASAVDSSRAAGSPRVRHRRRPPARRRKPHGPPSPLLRRGERALEIRWVGSAEYEALRPGLSAGAGARRARRRRSGRRHLGRRARRDETTIINLTYQIERPANPMTRVRERWAKRREAPRCRRGGVPDARPRARGKIAIVTNRGHRWRRHQSGLRRPAPGFDLSCAARYGHKNPRFDAVQSGLCRRRCRPRGLASRRQHRRLPKLSQALRGTGDAAFSEFGHDTSCSEPDVWVVAVIVGGRFPEPLAGRPLGVRLLFARWARAAPHAGGVLTRAAS